MSFIKHEKKFNGNYKWYIAEIGTFIAILIFQIILNINEIVPRSLPDEIGALSVAAKLCGYDWSYVLSQANSYYGFGTTIIFAPLFYIVKNPLILYQVLLAGGAVLRTIPVFICFSLLKKYSEEYNITEAILISTISVIAAPTRATNIDNEPMLILIAWTIVYLLTVLQDNISKKKRNAYSLFLFFILGYSLTVHTRAYIYVLAVLIVCIIFHLIYRRALVNYTLSFSIYFLLFFVVNYAKKVIQNTVYFSDIYQNTVLNNTVSGVAGNVAGILKNNFFNVNGITNFFSLFFSNIWITFTYYQGIIIVFICMFAVMNVKIIKKRQINVGLFSKNIWILPAVFLLIVFVFSLIGLSILWISSADMVRNYGNDLSRGYFYLRYIGNGFGPIIFIALLILKKYGIRRDIFWGVIIIQLFACKFTYAYSLQITLAKEKYSGDWFGYFAPLSFTGAKYSENMQNGAYYLQATVISLIIFSMYYLLIRKKYIKFFYILMCLIQIYQYSYSVINWDKPYSHSANYYGSVNATYELLKTEDKILDNIEHVYYCNEIFGPQFLMQFVMRDKVVISDYPQVEEEDMIIIGNDIGKLKNKIGFKLDDYYIFLMDENEFIIVNNNERFHYLKNYYDEWEE